MKSKVSIYQDRTSACARLVYYLSSDLPPAKVDRYARMRALESRNLKNENEPLTNSGEYESLRRELSNLAVLKEYGVDVPIEDLI